MQTERSRATSHEGQHEGGNTVNSFGFRYIRQDGLYRAEYRLAHWAGHRVVRGDDGEPVLYAHASDAGLRAATELVKALNGNSTFWAGKTGNEARAAAELLFKARDHGESEGCAV